MDQKLDESKRNNKNKNSLVSDNRKEKDFRISIMALIIVREQTRLNEPLSYDTQSVYYVGLSQEIEIERESLILF